MDVGYPCLIFFNIMKYMVTEADARITGIAFSGQAIACGFLEMAIGGFASAPGCAPSR